MIKGIFESGRELEPMTSGEFPFESRPGFHRHGAGDILG